MLYKASALQYTGLMDLAGSADGDGNQYPEFSRRIRGERDFRTKETHIVTGGWL